MGSKISWFGGHMARTVRELKVWNNSALEQRKACIPLKLYRSAACKWLCCFACKPEAAYTRTQDRLRLVDLVLEVRDARIPFSSANPELDRLVQHKRRLVVLNKADLAEPDKQQVPLKTSCCSVSQHVICFTLAVPAANATFPFLVTQCT